MDSFTMNSFVKLGKVSNRKFALYFNDEVMNLCDTKAEVKVEWLSVVYDYYMELIKQYSQDEKNTSQSGAQQSQVGAEALAKIREDERKLLEKARESVKICYVLY